ncbi:MAG: serine--tRNA ligase, partial [Candidatus Gastranaerophilales bacterium]|nr:serine--tRNA ligase [Candidatus Gastranaerophilales bacterium]
MLDIKLIRETPDKVNELLKRRNPELSIDEVIDIDKQRREVQTKADNLRSERKRISQEIGKLIKEGKDASSIQDEVRKMGEETKQLEILEAELNETQKLILLNIPNIPDETTPVGCSEADNPVIKTVGEVPVPSFKVKPHWEVGLDLEIIDFERGVKISESRFTIYKGAGARLERALINFFLNLHTEEHGYTEILPPFLVNASAMTGTGQLPKFKDDMYKCEDEDLYLIPTAEVPLTNMYMNEILREEDLPVYITAYTPCFRREA